MSSETEIISFLKLGERFMDHLLDESNRQILFTGPFGSGKTTFLRSFFTDTSLYEVIHIFPVNYSLHNNADICEILKYDLILELISKKAFDEIDISDFSKYVYAISQVTDNWFGKMLSLFSETGKDLTAAVELLDKSQSSAGKIVENLSDPMLQIRRFKGVIDKVKDYGYEDYITNVIKTKLTAISNGKKKVLIVDDLDRIDPDHLFRMISVFSAHIDHQTEENKFGFDKIVFVGDLQNFKGLYSHKFGANNNFHAFISKLSSKSPFNFNPSGELYQNVPDLLSQFQFRNSQGGYFPMISFSQSAKRWLTYIICSFIESGIISLRDIQKAKKDIIIIENKRIPNLRLEYVESEVYILSIILKHVLPGTEISSLFETAIRRPLSIESILEPERYNLNVVLSELSRIPLALLKYNEIQNLDYKSIDSTLDDSISIRDKKLHLEIIKDNNSRRVYCTLTQIDASEANVILLTLHAIQSLENWINYSR